MEQIYFTFVLIYLTFRENYGNLEKNNKLDFTSMNQTFL